MDDPAWPERVSRWLATQPRARAELAALGDQRPGPPGTRSPVPAPTGPDELRLRNLQVYLTGHCNLRCSYCNIVPANPLVQGVMSEATIDALARFVRRHRDPAAPSFLLEVLGGEPLLHLDQLTLLLDRIRQAVAPLSLEVLVTTNGTCLPDPLWTLLDDWPLQLAISLDGHAALHDRRRPTATGGSTHATVLRHLETLWDRGYGERITLSPVFELDELDELERALDFFAALDERHPLRLSTLYDALRSAQAGHTPEPLAAYRPAIRAFFARYARRVAELSRTPATRRRLAWFPDQYLSRILLRQEPPPLACSAGTSRLAVTPAGAIAPCLAVLCDRSLAGHVQEPERIELSRLLHHADPASWSVAPVGGDPACDCTRCLASWYCRARICRQRNVLLGGDFSSPGPYECERQRALFTASVWLAAQLGGQQSSADSPPPAPPSTGSGAPQEIPLSTNQPPRIIKDVVGSPATDLIEFCFGLLLTRHLDATQRARAFTDFEEVLVGFCRRRIGVDVFPAAELGRILDEQPELFLCATKVLRLAAAPEAAAAPTLDYEYTRCAFEDWVDDSGALCAECAASLQRTLAQLLLGARPGVSVTPHFRHAGTGGCRCRIRLEPFQHLRLIHDPGAGRLLPDHG